ALGAGFALFLARRTAEHATEEAGLLLVDLSAFGQGDQVKAQAAVEIGDAHVAKLQRAPDNGPGTVEIGAQIENRIAVAVVAQTDAAGRIEVARSEQRYGTALLHTTCHAHRHFVEQRRFEAGIAATRSKIDVGRAAGRALGAGDEDFTGIALHTRFDAHAHAGFGIRGDAGDATAQTASNARGTIDENLPRCGNMPVLLASVHHY